MSKIKSPKVAPAPTKVKSKRVTTATKKMVVDPKAPVGKAIKLVTPKVRLIPTANLIKDMQNAITESIK